MKRRLVQDPRGGSFGVQLENSYYTVYGCPPEGMSYWYNDEDHAVTIEPTNREEARTMSNNANVKKEDAARAVVEIALNSADGEFTAEDFSNAPEYTIEELTEAAYALEEQGLLASTAYKTGLLGLPVDLFVVTRAFRRRFNGVCDECLGTLDGGGE